MSVHPEAEDQRVVNVEPLSYLQENKLLQPSSRATATTLDSYDRGLKDD